MNKELKDLEETLLKAAEILTEAGRIVNQMKPREEKPELIKGEWYGLGRSICRYVEKGKHYGINIWGDWAPSNHWLDDVQVDKWKLLTKPEVEKNPHKLCGEHPGI